MNRVKSNLPNCLTLINLSLGVIAILFAVNDKSVNHLVNASLVILFAAITDRLDGKVARMLGVTSDLGKELDSLSDLISFGVAPIIISWKISFSNIGPIGYLLAVIFPIAGAYRLARYNVTTFDNVFRGIPITIAGSFLSIVNLYNCNALNNKKYTDIHSVITILIIVFLSIMMVSKIKIKKL